MPIDPSQMSPEEKAAFLKRYFQTKGLLPPDDVSSDDAAASMASRQLGSGTFARPAADLPRQSPNATRVDPSMVTSRVLDSRVDPADVKQHALGDEPIGGGFGDPRGGFRAEAPTGIARHGEDLRNAILAAQGRNISVGYASKPDMGRPGFDSLATRAPAPDGEPQEMLADGGGGGSGPMSALLKFTQGAALTPEEHSKAAYEAVTKQRQARESHLAEALRAASANRLAAGLGRAGATIGAAIGGVRADTSQFDAMERDADRPVHELAAQRQDAQQQAQLDPRSPESMSARALFEKAFPGQKAPPGMTAASFKEQFPFLSHIADREAKAAQAAEALSFRQQEAEANRTFRDEQARQQRDFMGQQNEANRQNARGLAAIAASGRNEARDEKYQREDEERDVPGYDFRQGARPSAKDADAMKKTTQASDIALDGIREMRDAFKTYGAEQFFGDQYGRYKVQHQTNLINLNNALGNALGTLQKSDLDRLQEIWPDPTQARSSAFHKEFLGRLGELEKTIRRARDAGAKYHNYQAEPASAASQGGGATVVETRTAPDGRVLERLSDGSLRVRQ